MRYGRTAALSISTRPWGCSVPLELTDAGLQIQSLAEIKAELEESCRAAYGSEVNLDPEEPLGQYIGIQAEREALVQQRLLAVFASFNPNNATGRALDARASINDIRRKPATRSTSGNLLATGTPGTVIPAGRTFQLIETSEIWSTDADVTIGGGGTVTVQATAQDTGPKQFTAGAGPSSWSILTTVSGWTSIEATADIDPEDIGRDVEKDAGFRKRRRDALLANGNDIEAIRSAVLNVNGVTAVTVYENRTSGTVNGIPAGHFEVVVEGGVEADIVAAIYGSKPPGASSHGSTIVNVTASSGDPVPIGYTRPTDIDVYVNVTLSTAGAERPLPSNYVELASAAVLELGNSISQIGRDQFASKFVGAVFTALRDDDGFDTISGVTIELSVTAIGGPYVDPLVIDIRERADFDSARIAVGP